jgi:hypothetical protein
MSENFTKILSPQATRRPADSTSTPAIPPFFPEKPLNEWLFSDLSGLKEFLPKNFSREKKAGSDKK